MTRRRLLYAVSGLALAMCGIALAIANGIGTEAERAYGQIKLGMRPAEVEEAIGPPVDEGEAERAFRKPIYDMKDTGVPALSISAPKKIECLDLARRDNPGGIRS